MKKILLFVVIFSIIVILNSQNQSADDQISKKRIVYFDAGMSFNQTRLNFASNVSNDGFEGKAVKHIDNYCIPNLNARLGLRVSERFILVSDFQTIGIREDFYYNLVINFLNYNHITPVKVEVNPITYYGGGILFYPHQRYQISATIGDAISPYSTDIVNGTGVSKPDFLGLGYNISLSYDIPQKKIGFLVGVSYFQAPTKPDLQVLFPISNIYSIGLFTKIRY